MKIIKTFLILMLPFIFLSCTSKNKFNISKNITSFSLNKNIYISDVPLKVDSPISFNLGFGTHFSKYIGLSTSTKYTPKVQNNKALDLQKAIALHNISLKEKVFSSFKEQILQDSFYRNKLVPFGADYIINLSVNKYEIDKSFFSSNAHIKIHLQLEILNKNADLVYKDVQISEIESDKYIYSQNRILNDKDILNLTLNEALDNSISFLIAKLKVN